MIKDPLDEVEISGWKYKSKYNKYNNDWIVWPNPERPNRAGMLRLVSLISEREARKAIVDMLRILYTLPCDKEGVFTEMRLLADCIEGGEKYRRREDYGEKEVS